MNYAELKLFFLWAAVLDIDRRSGNVESWNVTVAILAKLWKRHSVV